LRRSVCALVSPAFFIENAWAGTFSASLKISCAEAFPNKASNETETTKASERRCWVRFGLDECQTRLEPWPKIGGCYNNTWVTPL
jgi:hypothetical protein